MPTSMVCTPLPTALIDRLRGDQTASAWLQEAALRLARMQLGHHPIDPLGWTELASENQDPSSPTDLPTWPT